MTLTIIQKGSSYFCYKDLKSKDQIWDYRCDSVGGWNGMQWSWLPDKVEIRSHNGTLECKLKYKQRIFRKSLFKMVFFNHRQEDTVDCHFQKSHRDIIFDFTFEQRNYLFHSHKNHYRILYQDQKQVASFNKTQVQFLNRDSFLVYAENDIDIRLLFCLAVFDDLANGGNASEITIDFGNLGGTKPSDNGTWRPRTTPNSVQPPARDRGTIP